MTDQATLDARWLKAAAAVFGLWAVMLPLGIGIIERSVAELHQQITMQDARVAAQLGALTVTDNDVLHRLTVVEVRQATVLERLAELDRQQSSQDIRLNTLERSIRDGHRQQ